MHNITAVTFGLGVALSVCRGWDERQFQEKCSQTFSLEERKVLGAFNSVKLNLLYFAASLASLAYLSNFPSQFLRFSKRQIGIEILPLFILNGFYYSKWCNQRERIQKERENVLEVFNALQSFRQKLSGNDQAMNRQQVVKFFQEHKYLIRKIFHKGILSDSASDLVRYLGDVYLSEGKDSLSALINWSQVDFQLNHLPSEIVRNKRRIEAIEAYLNHCIEQLKDPASEIYIQLFKKIADPYLRMRRYGLEVVTLVSAVTLVGSLWQRYVLHLKS